MNAPLRQALSALAVSAIVALALAGTALTALSLRDAQANVSDLGEQVTALQAREKRLPAPLGRDPVAAPSFEARTVTQAGAALQQRVEAAIGAARGRLVSSKADIDSHASERRISLAAELTIAEPDLQSLLYDLETGRPYLFVDSFEARASEGPSEGGVLHVSLSLSGQWSEAK